MTITPHPAADKIREAMIRAKTERRHGETMEEALVRELAGKGLIIVKETGIARSASAAIQD